MSARILIVVMLLINAKYCLALQFDPTEMITINWGDGSNQLMIDEPGFEDVNYTPEDSSDDYIVIAGPTQAIVDRYENIYFVAYQFLQLKAFNNTGSLMFDFSKGQSGYNPEHFAGGISKMHVDSLCQIYILEGLRRDYVAVIDTLGELLDRLSPHGTGSGIPITNMYAGSYDVLIFYLRGDEHYAYYGGEFREGGSLSWLAKDGYYYYANLEGASIRFIKYNNPDIHGTPQSIDENLVTITGSPAKRLSFIGVDDNMNIYILLRGHEKTDRRLQVYDSSFNLLGEIVFPQLENRYLWYMPPFMRPSDDNIYEFRCLDDGLHVIRWSKQ